MVKVTTGIRTFKDNVFYIHFIFFSEKIYFACMFFLYFFALFMSVTPACVYRTLNLIWFRANDTQFVIPMRRFKYLSLFFRRFSVYRNAKFHRIESVFMKISLRSSWSVREHAFSPRITNAFRYFRIIREVLN